MIAPTSLPIICKGMPHSLYVCMPHLVRLIVLCCIDVIELLIHLNLTFYPRETVVCYHLGSDCC